MLPDWYRFKAKSLHRLRLLSFGAIAEYHKGYVFHLSFKMTNFDFFL